ncbi:hypothetical protein N7490_011674 [Penicillium lividum]|nr:hypothetical protein N7490_011674 [Penicillium lividum]
MGSDCSVDSLQRPGQSSEIDEEEQDTLDRLKYGCIAGLVLAILAVCGVFTYAIVIYANSASPIYNNNVPREEIPQITVVDD